MSTLFVGLDNPQSMDPRYALFPHPPGCAGHRLMEMMQEVEPTFTRGQYINIPKTNLFPTGMCPKKKRKDWLHYAGVLLIAQKTGRGDKIVLFGNDVRNAILWAHDPDLCWDTPMRWVMMDGSRYAWVPHPSGRNTYYNDTRKRRKVARFLRKLV
jgi:hypothetical protein